MKVQLRTIPMDSRANLEHQLRYEKNRTFSEEMSTELRECAELSAEIDRKMDRIRKAVAEKTARDQLG